MKATGTKADALLLQLLELVKRRARLADIPTAQRTLLADLLTGLAPLVAPHQRPRVALSQIRTAWDADALRLLTGRDVETVRTWLATQDIR